MRGIGKSLLLFGFLLVQCSKGGVPPDLKLIVEPPSVSFGAVPKGQTAETTITLKHAGMSGTLRLESFNWKSGSSAELSFEEPPVKELEPGQATTMLIRYSPADSTPDYGVLVISHNVPPHYKTEVEVSAVAQVGYLGTEPRDIDFGEVRGGEQKDLEIKIVNLGTDSVTVLKPPYLGSHGSEDFSIVGEIETPGGQDYPFELNPSESLKMTMRYKPKGGDADFGSLVVETLYLGSFDLAQFPVKGREVGPHVLISPGVIDFGLVQLNETREIVVTVDNTGYSTKPEDSLLVIPAGGIALAEGSDPGLFLVESAQMPESKAIPASDWQIKAEAYPGYPQYSDVPEMKTFIVRWYANHPQPDLGLPIGTVLVSSNDLGSGLVSIDVRGRIAVPMIDVFPSPVSFGSVALGIQTQQVMRIVNTGNGPLVFSAPISISDDPHGEFSIVQDPSFLPTKPDFDPEKDCVVSQGQEPPQNCSIPAGGFREIILKFKNTVDNPYEQVQAKVWLRTNAYNTPVLSVDLIAKRAEAPTCVPKLVPATLNFGAVVQGESATKTMFLVNDGTGYCSFQGCAIYDCPTLASFINTCNKGFANSKYFTIENPQDLPPGTQNGMLPGFKYPIKVRFDSPVGDFLFTNFYGLLWCQVYDSYKQQTVELPAKQAGWGGGEAYPVNLMAILGYVNIVVTPRTIDFGLQYAGCASLPKKVTIRNTGNSPLTLKKVYFHGCTPEMKALTPLPADNTLIKPSESIDIYLNFVPQQAGSQTCYLKIESNDLDEPVIYVKLMGKGTLDKTITDKFKQVSGQEFDLLIVLDDCACTLVDYGSNIRAQINDFISNGAIWNKDFHVGIIIMNIDDKKRRGCLNEGDRSIMPRFVTPTMSDAKDKFRKVFEAIVDQHSSDTLTKGGLLASYLALSEPLIVKTNKTCTVDADCTGDPSVCPDPSACDYICMEGFCGGYNWGFYRPDAYLDVVYISKADDQSPGTLNDYREMMDSIKGPANREFIKLHAVTWVDYCEGHAGHGEGKRYIAMSKEFGGQQAIICEDFSWLLKQIGSGGNTPLKKQFFLSALPSSQTTIQVKVGGKACTSGWSYDASSNSIIFDPAGPCMPQYSQDIEVTYDIACGGA